MIDDGEKKTRNDAAPERGFAPAPTFVARPALDSHWTEATIAIVCEDVGIARGSAAGSAIADWVKSAADAAELSGLRGAELREATARQRDAALAEALALRPDCFASDSAGWLAHEIDRYLSRGAWTRGQRECRVLPPGVTRRARLLHSIAWLGGGDGSLGKKRICQILGC